METRSERFRAKSLECSHAAQRTRDQATKTSFLELAERWRELADHVESLERERLREQ
jgi:hypothetical protein